MDDTEDSAGEEHGLTDEDMEQIAAYLRKPAHLRSVDDLRRRRER